MVSKSIDRKITFLQVKSNTKFMRMFNPITKTETKIDQEELENVRKIMQVHAITTLKRNSKGDVPCCKKVYAFDQTLFDYLSTGEIIGYDDLFDFELKSLVNDIKKQLELS